MWLTKLYNVHTRQFLNHISIGILSEINFNCLINKYANSIRHYMYTTNGEEKLSCRGKYIEECCRNCNNYRA